MKLFFSFQLEDNAKTDFTEEAKLILDEIYSFVYGRLSPLADEMDKEAEGYAVIMIHADLKVRFFDFSTHLTIKLENSILPQDYEYLANMLWKMLFPGVIPPTN